jgi:hypothetical protein
MIALVAGLDRTALDRGMRHLMDAEPLASVGDVSDTR